LEVIAPEVLDRRKKQVAVVLRSQAKLPAGCPFCGAAASDSRVITWRRNSPHTTGSGVVVGGLIGAWVYALFDRIVRPREQVISFRLPYCSDCHDRKLEIIAFDWDNYRVEATCEPAFKAALSDDDNSNIAGQLPGPPASDD